MPAKGARCLTWDCPRKPRGRGGRGGAGCPVRARAEITGKYAGEVREGVEEGQGADAGRGLLGHGPGPGGRAPAPATHDETPTTAVTDLTAPGAPRTPPAGGHDVASDTGADTTTPIRTQPNMPEQAQNTPKTLKIKQKPAPRVHHDAGLSTGSMVGLAGFEPTTP